MNISIIAIISYVVCFYVIIRNLLKFERKSFSFENHIEYIRKVKFLYGLSLLFFFTLAISDFVFNRSNLIMVIVTISTYYVTLIYDTKADSLERSTTDTSVSNSSNKQPKLIKMVTHSGQFHADDVFSSALLSATFSLDNKKSEIIRVKNEKDIPADADIVYDIVYGEFDHHSGDDKIHENTDIPYASFGLLWDKYGENFIKQIYKANEKKYLSYYDLKQVDDSDFKKVFDRVLNTLVLQIDGNDNGIFNDNYDISSVILEGNPEMDSDETKAFFSNCNIASVILINNIIYSLNKVLSAREVENSSEYLNEDKSILFLKKYGNYHEIAKNNVHLKLVVFESNRGGWNVMAISDDHIPRITIPAEYSKLDHVSFVHKHGFLLVADTKEDAIKLAKKLIEDQKEI